MKGKNSNLSSNSDLRKALIKRAMGFDAKEVIEEYVGGDDGVKLTKKKVTYKFVPPDVTALKLLIDGEEKDVTLPHGSRNSTKQGKENNYLQNRAISSRFRPCFPCLAYPRSSSQSPCPRFQTRWQRQPQARKGI